MVTGFILTSAACSGSKHRKTPQHASTWDLKKKFLESCPLDFSVWQCEKSHRMSAQTRAVALMLTCEPPPVQALAPKCSRSVMPRWSKKQGLWELGHVIVDAECTSARCHLHVCLGQCGITIIELFLRFCSRSALWDGIRRDRVVFAKTCSDSNHVVGLLHSRRSWARSLSAWRNG